MQSEGRLASVTLEEEKSVRDLKTRTSKVKTFVLHSMSRTRRVEAQFLATNWKEFECTESFQPRAVSIIIIWPVDLYQLVKAVELEAELGETSHVDQAGKKACSVKMNFWL